MFGKSPWLETDFERTLIWFGFQNSRHICGFNRAAAWLAMTWRHLGPAGVKILNSSHTEVPAPLQRCQTRAVVRAARVMWLEVTERPSLKCLPAPIRLTQVLTQLCRKLSGSLAAACATPFKRHLASTLLSIAS